MTEVLDRPTDRLRYGTLLGAQRVAIAGAALLGDPLAKLLRGSPRTDPYPLYEQLRGAGTISRSRLGLWVVTSHRLCDEVLRSPHFGIRAANGSGAGAGGFDALLSGPLSDSFIDQDPPEHTRLRRIAAPAFRPKIVRGWAPEVERVVLDLIDRIDGRRRIDLMTDLSAPFPITVISKLLGIPEVDVARFTRIGALVGQSLDGVRSLRQARALQQANAELDAMFVRLAAERRADPRDDVISLLAQAHGEGTLSTRDLTATCGLLLVAGFETTVNLIGNAVAALQSDRSRWEELVADPGLASAVVEETLRWDPSVQATERVAHEDTVVGRQAVVAGDTVVVLTAAGNRDPEVYSAPGRFDLHRSGEPEHLAFSSGIHYCLGAPLARLEGETALRVLAERMPRLRLLPGARRRQGATIRGFATLPAATDL